MNTNLTRKMIFDFLLPTEQIHNKHKLNLNIKLDIYITYRSTEHTSR